MKTRAVLCALLLVLLFTWGWSQSPSAPEASLRVAEPFAAQQLPPEFSGGRPGVFRFHPQEEMRGDRQELAELRISIERTRGLLQAVKDPAARAELQEQLGRWQTHISRMEQRQTTSAGPTAATVESRLNAMKGARSCGVCHGGHYGPNTPAM